MEWISVKDKSPDKKGYYLCFSIKWKKIHVLRFDEWAKNTRKRFWGFSGSETFPSHWMPLPPPPKE